MRYRRVPYSGKTPLTHFRTFLEENNIEWEYSVPRGGRGEPGTVFPLHNYYHEQQREKVKELVGKFFELHERWQDLQDSTKIMSQHEHSDESTDKCVVVLGGSGKRELAGAGSRGGSGG